MSEASPADPPSSSPPPPPLASEPEHFQITKVRKELVYKCYHSDLSEDEVRKRETHARHWKSFLKQREQGARNKEGGVSEEEGAVRK